MTHPDGAVERFANNPQGRLIAHHDPQGHATRYHRDPAGRLRVKTRSAIAWPTSTTATGACPR